MVYMYPEPKGEVMGKRKPGLFRDMEIKNLKPEAKEYWRREGQGFSIRVLPSGVKTWYYIYTFEGKKKQMRLGKGNYPDVSLEDARIAFKDAAKKVANGKDPLEEERAAALERKQTPIVADFITEYIVGYAKKKIKCWQDVERALLVEVKPKWGKRKITDVTRRDINLIRDEVAERAPVMANRLLSYISGMFTYAVEQGVLEESPYYRVKRAVKESPKERALLPAEIKQLWVALDSDTLQMSTHTMNILKLVLLTAQRPGEVAGMHSKEIDGHWWTIPGSRTKNKETTRVYLTDSALELIGDTKGKGYIFETKKRSVNGIPVTGSISVNALSFAIRRNIKGQSITDKVKRRKGQPYKRGGEYTLSKPSPESPNRVGLEMFSPHDLRRTAVTLMAIDKVPYETRERVVNHTMGKMDKTYNQHDYDDEKQMAMEAIERKVLNIISGTEGKVINIQQGRKKAANH